MSSGGWTRTPAPRSVVQAVPVAISSQNFDTPHRGFLPASLCKRRGEYAIFPSPASSPLFTCVLSFLLLNDPHAVEGNRHRQQCHDADERPRAHALRSASDWLR